MSVADCIVYLAGLRQLEPRHSEWLDQAETLRRSRFRSADDRDRFTLAAAMLRAIAAQEPGRRPADVVVDRRCPECGEPHGRPRLPGGRLHASITHSGDLVAVAVTAAGPVGVDVEQTAAIDYQPLLRSVCTPAEQAFVHGLRDFLTYWTRKEAVLKATGYGLRMPMTNLAVTRPTEPPGLTRIDAGSPSACRMADLELRDGYVGAAAVLTDTAVGFRLAEATPLLTRASG